MQETITTKGAEYNLERTQHIRTSRQSQKVARESKVCNSQNPSECSADVSASYGAQRSEYQELTSKEYIIIANA